MVKREIHNIGTVECINLPDAGVFKISAKIDTGATFSVIWASNIREEDGILYFTLFNKQSSFYTGQEIVAKKYEVARIRNSFGHIQQRYRVALKITMGSQTFRAKFSLANRSRNKYAILLGRKLLHGRFVVDVAKKNIHKLQVKAC
ncbi:MAG TPA: RimK/LysX family protein [Patescibacteria group bacterium]|nr:RimK/LysX family protein [Patescibacteria group bacterium]